MYVKSQKSIFVVLQPTRGHFQEWQHRTWQCWSSPAFTCGVGSVVDVVHQLGKGLSKEDQVNFVPNVVLCTLQEVQQGLQE